MLKLPKQIASEFFQYTTDLPVDAFIIKLRGMLNSTTDSDTYINFQGEFTNDNEFEITRQWGEFSLNPFWPFFKIKKINALTGIRGFVFKNKYDQTQLNLVIFPNSTLKVLFLISNVLCY